MPFYDVYLGNLDDPTFDPDGGDWNGNVPSRESEFFPPTGAGDRPFFRVIRMIESGELQGKQTDWGGWVARVRPTQIRELLDQFYDGDPTYAPDSESHLKGQLERLRAYVEQLDPDTDVALVATEL